MIRSTLFKLFATTFMAVMSFLPASHAFAAQTQSPLTIPISTTGATGSFNGMLRITSFAVQNNALVATGMVTGTVQTATGLSSIARTVTIPVVTATKGTIAKATSASCDVLHLELGPLDLDLLGLVVHLDRIVLDVSAAPGAGNLLGNLLCSVTNLLNTAGSLSQLANLLNQILGLLG